jgi:hypothetical protein
MGVEQAVAEEEAALQLARQIGGSQRESHPVGLEPRRLAA